MRRSRLFPAALLSLALACGGPKSGKKAPEPDSRPFPAVQVPEAYADAGDRLAYAAEHYWDAYFAGSGRTDSLLLLGVPSGEVEQALANYIALLDGQDLGAAQKNVRRFFGGICEVQRRDSSSQFYTQFTQTVARYLYDPNSPLRDEDLYLPFVQGLAESPLTRDDMRPAYRYEAMMCALNPRGSVAPDFKARRADGSVFSLHGVNAPCTLLFFSNPGCHSCKEIIEDIGAELSDMVSSGALAVVNVYIDDDLDAWREYVGNYPQEWYTGYDYLRVVRDELLYDVRAIPSLYLLDAEKRILAKDAPFEKVLALLGRG